MVHMSFGKHHALSNNSKFLPPGKQTKEPRKRCNRERHSYEDKFLADAKVSK